MRRGIVGIRRRWWWTARTAPCATACPDTEVLARSAERLLADPATRSVLVEPNSSRYRAADAWRIISSRARWIRSHHLVVVEDDAPLRSALAAAAGGATVEQIVDTVAADTGFTRDEVAATSTPSRRQC